MYHYSRNRSSGESPSGSASNGFYYGKRAPVNKSQIKFDEKYIEKFLSDWEGCRNRHEGQQQIIDDFRSGKFRYQFIQAGRKFAKTTTLIDIAWLACNTKPNIVCYMGFPSISQGIDVIWDECRAQQCDLKETYMFDRYVSRTDSTRHVIKFNNGSWIKLFGTWVEVKGRGTQPDLLIFDEFQDCDPEYIEAMDPNLAAKPDSHCIMSGTPPKVPGHFQDWRERVRMRDTGRVYHYTSYDNKALPHLEKWLNEKHAELEKINKIDIWLREYMAEDCFSSSDRVLPDPVFHDREKIFAIASNFAYSDRIPIVAISVHKNYVCAILGILCPKKALFLTDMYIPSEVWNVSYEDIYPAINAKVKELNDFCGKKVRQVVWDDSGSFTDIISGVTKCRKDLKWQDRGIPLLKEMMIKNKVFFSRDLGEVGLECQKLLMDESIKTIEKSYPKLSTLGMIVNEYFQKDPIVIEAAQEFDKYAALRQMGIPCPTKKRGRTLFHCGS
jgi:hypothetical protein